MQGRKEARGEGEYKRRVGRESKSVLICEVVVGSSHGFPVLSIIAFPETSMLNRTQTNPDGTVIQIFKDGSRKTVRARRV